MALFPRAIDLYLTYRMIRSLMTPFKQMAAYKEGIIDEKGKILKKRSQMSPMEKDVFGFSDRMIVNLKRLINKIPGPELLKNTATVFFLMKEDDGQSMEDYVRQFIVENEGKEDEILKMLEEADVPSNVAGSAGDQVQTQTAFKGCKRSKLGDCEVFHVNAQTYMNALRGKHPNHSYKKYVHDDDPTLSEIRMFARKNPGQSIMIKSDEMSGVYTYLKKGSKK